MSYEGVRVEISKMCALTSLFEEGRGGKKQVIK
jgi:hypothetical protein